MYEVKLKTLDGRTHAFNVADEITVFQFKEIIHEKMAIEVECQRLLFQGRVLQDDSLLSSYDVAGNVMHLATRPPPNQTRPATASPEQDENSDINREQIRNILSDVLSNLGDMNNVSVSNEGNRMDITVNIPPQNRLSLARLRHNYVHRLLQQSRNLMEYMSHVGPEPRPEPRPDHEVLRQANAYDLGPNEDRLTDVTSEPLPVNNLADLITEVRSLWTDMDPHLIMWQQALRNGSLENHGEDTAMLQRMHDQNSRLVHLFSHMLHIMSDYLVEFHRTDQQPSPTMSSATTGSRSASASRATATPVPATSTDAATSTASLDNSQASQTPLTAGCGESAVPAAATVTSTDPVSATTTESQDRSRFLYVFSEMPAQLLQVRLDVDTHLPDLLSIANQFNMRNAGGRSGTATTDSTRPPEQSRTATPNTQNAASATATAATETSLFEDGPNSSQTDEPRPAPTQVPRSTRPSESPGRTSTTRRREIIIPSDNGGPNRHNFIFGGNSNLTNSFLNGTGGRFNVLPRNTRSAAGSDVPPTGSSATTGATPTAGTTPTGANPLSGDHVDPYVRCQSRHFQLSTMRTGSIISAYSTFRTSVSNAGNGPNPSAASYTMSNRDRSRLRSRLQTSQGIPYTTTTSASSTNQTHATSTAASDSGAAPPPPTINQIFTNIMNSIFNIGGDSNTTNTNSHSTSNLNTTTTTTNRATAAAAAASNGRTGSTASNDRAHVDTNAFISFMQAATQMRNIQDLSQPLSELLPYLVHERLADNSSVVNRLASLVLQNTSMASLFEVMQHNTTSLNRLRHPLQEILRCYQESSSCGGRRETLVEHIVGDLETNSEPFFRICEQLRSSDLLEDISDNDRIHMNQTIDVQASFHQLFSAHVRSIVDMVQRSPTDVGFGELLVNSVTALHDEAMVMLEIICDHNANLRSYVLRNLFQNVSSNLAALTRNPNPNMDMMTVFINSVISVYNPPDNIEQLSSIVTDGYLRFKIESNSASTLEIQEPAGHTDIPETIQQAVLSLAGETAIPELLVASAQDEEMADGSNSETMPSEWAEIITRDSQLPPPQPQPAFSDAYLSGMPAKRRKLQLSQRQHSALSSPAQLLDECLHQATSEVIGPTEVASPGAAIGTGPVTDVPAPMVTSFQQLVTRHIRERLDDTAAAAAQTDVHFTTTQKPNFCPSSHSSKRD